MDTNFLGSQPFHAASERESAIMAGQCAKLIPHQRPGPTFFCKTVIIMGLAEMNKGARTSALLDAVVHVTIHLDRIDILKQLGVGPLHSTASEQVFRRFPGT